MNKSKTKPHSTYTKQTMSTDQQQETPLPQRKFKIQFPKVPDFNDDDYEATPAAFHKALRQRGRERLVGWAYLHWLADRVQECYYNEGSNSIKNCAELGEEYMMRLNCPHNVCAGDQFIHVDKPFPAPWREKTFHDEDFTGAMKESRQPYYKSTYHYD
eukprot:TRINITY_DN942_c0_g1_i1.p1 TRINITY_DN942_c0_g1~~TRINITY_DN942_c0_g1_i1.p1  ORF type:complete len:158 (+),score=27.46 TRINITY_DN942_c0_g1_i1:35-508(+)